MRAQKPTNDLLLRNARIIDGRKPAYRGDVAIRGDTITAIAPKIDGDAKRVIDLGGRDAGPPGRVLYGPAKE